MSALAAEARRLVEDAQLDGYSVPTYQSEADTLAAAQVMATLALVEQQRIANLAAIAHVNPFLELNEAGVEIESAFAVQVDVDGFQRTMRLRPEIATALGVGS